MEDNEVIKWSYKYRVIKRCRHSGCLLRRCHRLFCLTCLFDNESCLNAPNYCAELFGRTATHFINRYTIIPEIHISDTTILSCIKLKLAYFSTALTQSVTREDWYINFTASLLKWKWPLSVAPQYGGIQELDRRIFRVYIRQRETVIVTLPGRLCHEERVRCTQWLGG